ncbi:MAG: T9SS type A sorting domain-containing protein [Bacteroidota bacterium]|nr:T9SS type A sorting domain-containing protein [Bacteroidota bacterium]
MKNSYFYLKTIPNLKGWSYSLLSKFICTFVLFTFSVNTFAQTYPTPQAVPYLQDFDASSALTYPIGIQGFRTGALASFTYSVASAATASDRVISSVIDYATITAAGTGVTTSTIHLITGSGSGNSLAISVFNRAAGFVSAVNATGIQDLRVSYDITILEQESISSVLGFAYLEYSVPGITGFATVPGSFYSTSGLTPGTKTSFSNLQLPNVPVADKPNVLLRWLTFSSEAVTNYISFSFDNISVTGTVIPFSTIAPQPLPYVQNFSTFSNVTGFPAGFAGFRTGALGAFDFVTANTTSMTNRTLSPPDYDISILTSGGTNTASTLHVVTTPGYYGVLASLFNRSAGYIVALNTSGWRNIKLSFDVTQLEVESVSSITGYGYFQYRTDNYASFSTIPGAFYSSSGKLTGQITSYVNLTLPGVAENLSKVQLRWLAYPSETVANFLSFSIGNISVTGDNIPAPASKLMVESVSPALKLIGTPLTVIVSSKNPGDIEVPVLSNTVFSLSSTGLGFTGATNYTITGGNSRLTVTGISYSSANVGITISANRTSGDLLTNATSATFDILASDPDAPVALPYVQNFGSTPIAAGTNTVLGMKFYRAGSASWKSTLSDAIAITDGSYTLRNYQGAISNITRCTSTLTGHANNGLGPQNYNNGSDVKLNISLGSRTFQNVLSLNTTGKTDLSYKYEVQLVENYSTVSQSVTTTTGYLALQYRVGSVAGWTTVNNTTYTTGTVIDQVTTFVGYLPAAANNQPLVQVRWITFQSSDLALTDYLSFALDNIEIASKKASKLVLKNISPASPTAGFNFSATVESQNEYGVVYPVSSATGLSLSANGSGVLSGTITTTLGAGTSSITLTDLKYSISASGITLTVYTTAIGQAFLSAGTSTFNVIPFVGATKLSITNVFPIGGTKILPGRTFGVVVQALNNSNNPGVVTNATNISLAISGGTGNLTGTTSLSMASGQSSITFTGLLYSQVDQNLTLVATATSGDALTASPASTAFTVGKIATNVAILGVFPAGSIIVGSPITVRIKLVDADGEGAYVLSNTPLSVSLAQGTGTLGGTLSGTAIARVDTVIDLKGITYSKAETLVGINIAAAGIATVTSSIFSVLPNPLSGLKVLYKEDFEKTIKVAGQANPALPAGMTMYNRDGKTAIPSFYSDYGTNAYVIRRIRQRGYVALLEDLIPTENKTFFYDNSGSSFPDSNFVAYTTSYFDNDPLLNPTADRWLVTPKISLTGNNLKLSVQGMSFTSSGNFEDKFQLLFSLNEPGSTLNTADWEAFTMKAEGLVNYPDSATFTALTVPITYSVSLPTTFNNQSVYFALRLVTPSPGGDRIGFDNILVTSSDVTSVEEHSVGSKPNLSIYPNPTTGAATLSFNSASGTSVVSFISVTGEVALTKELSLEAGTQLVPISVAELPAGIYIVKVVTASNVLTTKLIIK